MGGLARSPPSAPVVSNASAVDPVVFVAASDLIEYPTPSAPIPQPIVPNAPCVAPVAVGVAVSASGSIVDTPLSRGSGSRFKRLKMSEDVSLNERGSPVQISSVLSDASAFQTFVESCNLNMIRLLNENKFLRSELAEVKSILMNLVNNQAPDPSSEIMPSYASVVKPKVVQKPVIINPKSPQKSDITRKQLVEKLNPKDYAVNGTSNTKTGGVVINCATSEDRNKLKKTAIALLGDSYDVSIPSKTLPRVRIFGYSHVYTEAEFLNVFKEQNKHMLSDSCVVNVIYMFSVKSQSRLGVKLEVDPISFSKLMKVGKVSVGFEYAWVREDLNVRHCFKCYGFNHSVSKCTSEIFRCPKCAGEHQKTECTSNIERCISCLDAVKQLHLNIDSNHSALSLGCPSYLHRIDLARRNVLYDA